MIKRKSISKINTKIRFTELQQKTVLSIKLSCNSWLLYSPINYIKWTRLILICQKHTLNWSSGKVYDKTCNWRKSQSNIKNTSWSFVQAKIKPFRRLCQHILFVSTKSHSTRLKYNSHKKLSFLTWNQIVQLLHHTIYSNLHWGRNWLANEPHLDWKQLQSHHWGQSIQFEGNLQGWW